MHQQKKKKSNLSEEEDRKAYVRDYNPKKKTNVLMSEMCILQK